MSCTTCKPMFNAEHDNYYCDVCRKGMGNAYYLAAKRAEKAEAKVAELLGLLREASYALTGNRSIKTPLAFRIDAALEPKPEGNEDAV